jgi:hypothetical protein
MSTPSKNEPELALRAVTNSVDNEELPRHRWYAIKEGFSAKLVSDTISEFAASRHPKLVAVEPFSGSGTSPVECARHGVKCFAYEVNPFLSFVGRAKLKQVAPHSITGYTDRVIAGIGRPLATRLEHYSTFSEQKGRKKWLFNRAVLRAFAGGWAATCGLFAPHATLLRLALVRATMDNCNAYPDGKCLRYKRLKSYRQFDPESVAFDFRKHADVIVADLEAAPLDNKPRTVRTMDARRLLESRAFEKFDFCVTSPPYLNSFDYSDVYRPELFLTGYATTNADLMKVRLRTVRSHLQANWKKPTQSDFGLVYARSLNELVQKQSVLWSDRIPLMVQAYFEDISTLLLALKKRAKRSARLKIAIGTSAYAGIVIPVDLIIAEIGERSGWVLDEVDVVRRLRSSGQHWKHEETKDNVPALRESIVKLHAPP